MLPSAADTQQHGCSETAGVQLRLGPAELTTSPHAVCSASLARCNLSWLRTSLSMQRLVAADYDRTCQHGHQSQDENALHCEVCCRGSGDSLHTADATHVVNSSGPPFATDGLTVQGLYAELMRSTGRNQQRLIPSTAMQSMQAKQGSVHVHTSCTGSIDCVLTCMM